MTFPAALPGRRQRKVDSTRSLIFEAAIAEFRRVGLSRASVARIAREAGVSRPSFYFHFPTKEHVLLELQWLEERALASRLEQARGLREALHELAEGLIELEARLGDADLFRDMIAIYSRRPSDLPIDERPFPIVDALARHFEDATARGELRAGLEAEAATRVCLTSVFGLFIGLPNDPAQRRADFGLLFSLSISRRKRRDPRVGARRHRLERRSPSLMNVFERDLFTDPELIQDPDPYYAELRKLGPVVREPHHGVYLVSGLEEVLAIYSDLESFSSVVSPLGPFVPLPEVAEGESLADVVTHRRHEIPLSDILPALDPPEHTRHRALLKRLFTPNRLKENEEFMWTLADELIDPLADRGEIEFCSAYGGPFSMLVIADLLGVPQEDYSTLVGWLQGDSDDPNLAGTPEAGQSGADVLARLYPYFTRYIEERRDSPGEDVMTQLATGHFPDGELPEVADVVRLAVILFAAGQETTARLLSTGMRILAEQPSLAGELRARPEAIPNFVEECLRFESPIKGSFRLALRDIRIAGTDVAAGSILMTMNGAANRDPRLFEDGDHFDPKRSNARRNIAFGHGEHFCPGASLARAEARISFERLLSRLDDLQLVDPDALSYAPSFLIRGLDALPLRFKRRV